ncbi:XrtA-associated tyrosine autokinase [Photobacterium kagoshimensis]|uniref:XrtA-associated tyrosine autokinase n=1 Tax=Photobacterium kagoshimensis TaxID=2910242 RepID=UPI003D151B08
MSTIEKAMGKHRQSAEKPNSITAAMKVQKEAKEKVGAFNAAASVSASDERSSVKATDSPPQALVSDKLLAAEEPIIHQPIYIDTERLKDMGMVMHTDEAVNVKINNEFRSIKQKLLENAFGSGAAFHQNGNLVMVSSALPDEGKTFSAVNLALSLASEKDKTVLLVDADVIKPSVSHTLDIDDKPGLIDYLVGNVSQLSDIIYPTSIPNLKLMPAGAFHHLNNELLASSKMEVLAKELASRYSDRVVVFDCPPLLGVVETVTLSKLLGQAMIVVEQDKTKIADVKAAVSQLNKDMAIGFIMNKAVRGAYSQYGYGYGYDSKAKKS